MRLLPWLRPSHLVVELDLLTSSRSSPAACNIRNHLTGKEHIVHTKGRKSLTKALLKKSPHYGMGMELSLDGWLLCDTPICYTRNWSAYKLVIGRQEGKGRPIGT